MTTDAATRARQVVAFVAVAVLIDWGLGTLLGGLGSYGDPQTSPVGALESARANTDAELFVLGGSRASHHIDPAILGDRLGLEVHNAGMDGQGVIFARAVQELVRSSGGQPAVFVLQVQAFDVMAYEPARAFVVSPYLDAMPATRQTLEREGYNVRVKLASRAFRYNSLVLQLTLNRLRGTPAAGRDSYLALDGSLEGSDVGIVGVPGRWESESREVSPQAVEVLREFIRSSIDGGSEVFLVTGPYLRAGPVEPAEIRANETIAQLAEAEGAHLIEIDEDRYPVFSDPALYYDLSHLNREGAEMYSRIFADLIAARRAAGTFIDQGAPILASNLHEVTRVNRSGDDR